MPEPSPCAPSTRIAKDGAGLLLPVRVTPKGGRNRIDGVATDADGTMRLRLTVTAAPEGGRANGAVIALLAKSFKLPKSSLSIAAGRKARSKTVLVAGDPRDILARIGTWGSEDER